MTRQWIVSIVYGTVIYYLTFSTLVWPRSKCLCRGHLSRCPWCHGAGTHLTYSRRALNAMVRKAAGR